MAEIQVMVGDPVLARHVETVAAGAGVALAADASSAAALVVCDQAGLTRLGEDGRVPGDVYRCPVVLVADAVADATWADAARLGVEQVVALPSGAALLDARIRSLGRHAATGALIRVIGVRGGCGATTLAVGLAQVLREHTDVVLVDGDATGPGLEVPLGIRGAGVRWAALTDIRGRMPASTLTARLPDSDGLPVLSHHVGETSGTAEAWPAVVGSLLDAAVSVVADVPRHALAGHPPVGVTRDIVVLPRDLAGLTCARQLVRDGLVGTQPVVVVRNVKSPVEFGAVRAAFDGLAVVTVPPCRGVVGAADFGDLADAVTRGAFARVCRDVVSYLRLRSGAS